MTTLRAIVLAVAMVLYAAPALSADGPAEEPAHGVEHAADAHGGDAHGGDHHAATPDWPKLGWHAFNLALLIGVLIYVARRPVVDALSNRAHDIRRGLTDAARQRDEAQQRHDEIVARLDRFEDEVDEMKAEASVAARHEEERLIERAHTEAARIAETAERNIREEAQKARIALRKEAVGLAVQLAEQTLRSQIQSDDQRRLARQFLASIQEDQG